VARQRRRRRHQDAYGKRAQREGFAARSIYKLEEMDRRLGLLRPGLRVLDLGAAPGSWSQYAARRVGPQGSVLGFDLSPSSVGLPAWAEVREGDVFDLDLQALGPFDVVLSDMAPSTTGQRTVDQRRSFELFMRALEIAGAVLLPGGSFLAKIFEGPETEDARAAMKERFGRVRTLKPKATRSESIEVFMAGLGRKRDTPDQGVDSPPPDSEPTGSDGATG
jgi:23S rRNA (uridine2552-2'-O)-methyltransferase